MRSFAATIRNSIVVLAIGFLVACGGPHPSTGSPPAAPPAVGGATVVVTDTELPRLLNVVATVTSRRSIGIQAVLSGTILELPVEPGDVVEEGALLVRLEAAELRSERDRAAAEAERAAAELDRFARLVQSGAVTRQDYDSARATARMAEQAVAALDARLAYAEQRAPFAGVVVSKQAEVGEIALPGRALLRLADPEQLELSADLPESAASAVKVGSELVVRDGDRRGTATVREKSPAADPLSRTVPITAVVNGLDGLRLGAFARLQVPIGRQTVRLVPASAVLRRGQLDLLAVVDDGRIDCRVVQIGRRFDDQVELLAGATAGERVLAEPPAAVTDGARWTGAAP